MTTLTDRQRELIARAHAADGCIEPWLEIKGGARLKMIEALAKRGLIEQTDGHWRLTQAAIALLQGEPPPAEAAPCPPERQSSPSKLAQIIERLQAGATIQELAALTGWQEHSLRGLLSHALPKKGLRIVAERPEGQRRKVYRIAEG